MTETDQLKFWQGEFGDAYIARNEASEDGLAARIAMWRQILGSVAEDEPTSILEVGANIGLNLRALGQITNARLFALEPNDKARQRLVADAILSQEQVIDGAANHIPLADASVDLCFTSGVLIHVHPDDLEGSCAEIHRVASKYIACVEYFAVEPEEISYRGRQGYLFKRDFGAFWMDGFPDLTLLDYGFFWKRATGLDNLTWWLFRKN